MFSTPQTAHQLLNTLNMRATTMHFIACVLLLSNLSHLSNAKSLQRRAASSDYHRWNSPCNDRVTVPHVTNRLVTIISGLPPSTPSESETRDLAQRLTQYLEGTSDLVHFIVNQTEKKLANTEHINNLKSKPMVAGIRRIRDVSEVRSQQVRPLIEEMYTTLTRIAIFLDSIRTDLQNLQFKSDSDDEMLELLTVLEQGGPWSPQQGSGQSHYGIYNQLCDILRHADNMRNHGLTPDIIPDEHAPTSATQAKSRDRQFQIMNTIRMALLDLAQNARVTLPEETSS